MKRKELERVEKFELSSKIWRVVVMDKENVIG
jgi:hypothetical protein